MLDHVETDAPPRRNVIPEVAGNPGETPSSDLASDVAGGITHVDCGYSTIGMPDIEWGKVKGTQKKGRDAALFLLPAFLGYFDIHARPQRRHEFTGRGIRVGLLDGVSSGITSWLIHGCRVGIGHSRQFKQCE